MLFAGTLGALNNAIAEDGIFSKGQFTGTSYCHEKFPAIRQSTLGNDLWVPDEPFVYLEKEKSKNPECRKNF